MGLMKTLIVGRENGVRAKIRSMLGGGSVDTSPDSSHSAPRYDDQPPPAEKAVGLKPEAPKDVNPPQGFEVVLHKDSLKPGQIVEIIISGKAIAVANVDGTFHACTNACPHADGPLGEGELVGKVLTCPYHGWQYDITTGDCITTPSAHLATYEVAIEGPAVCVKL